MVGMGCRIIIIFLEMYQTISVMGPGGQPCYAIGNFPQFLLPHDPSKTEEDRTNMKKKVGKVRKRMYIDPGTVLSLSNMFYVCKGLNDIQMVYSGTLCGLNLALWAPHFGLPIFQHNLRTLLPGYSQWEMGVVNMFLTPLLP